MDRKDFKIRTPGHPSYINRSDAEKYGVPGNVVWIRYAKLTMKVAVRLIEGQWIKGPDDDSNV